MIERIDRGCWFSTKLHGLGRHGKTGDEIYKYNLQRLASFKMQQTWSIQWRSAVVGVFQNRKTNRLKNR